MIRIFRTITMAILAVVLHAHATAQYSVSSPDNSLRVEVTVNNTPSYSVFLNKRMIVAPSEIALILDGEKTSDKYEVVIAKNKHISEEYNPIVPFKSSTVREDANSLIIAFTNSLSLEFRAYNNGVAWRWISDIPKEIKVENEITTFEFPSAGKVWFPEESSLISHYERRYVETLIDSISPDRFCSLPVLTSLRNGTKIAITEADLYNYPCLFLEGNSSGNGFSEKFPSFVLKAKNKKDSDRNEEIAREADYIARTTGKRSFPWRVMMIAETDDELITNDLVYTLSRKGKSQNFEWVKPGRVAWDWWNAWNIYNVDFEAGINTQTYKYYIDFASQYGLEYIILDEGWSNTTDLYKVIPEIDLEEIIRYGKEKNVGVILWVLWKPLFKQLEILDEFQKMGIKGIKVDFMQRADQWMVEYYELIANEAAKRQLLVDFHGAFKPSGLRAKYPNVLSYEGVKGLENAKWSFDITPHHDATLPFTRQLAGPMDYTPGAMRNGGLKNFFISWTRPISQGTRAHQVALYVIFESGLQMFCDNPTNYLRNPETTDFMSQIPVTWDTTIVKEAVVGEYLLVARKKEQNWYLGAITDEEAREFSLGTGFLPGGNFEITIFADGYNAHRTAEDFRILKKQIANGDTVNINMVAGGGWAAIIKPVSW
ncbi:MAG: glycoside hydrolase family 97 protein [Bacteroidales bacterium]|nr:glycoside hydrolase family 97 protein [Candidatus Cloacimonadota bacterium]MCK9168699.1 glycoside hydrolase family 97 protein [Bacteroidales bacterium]MDD2323794.1 glycoside hydrolase family 97 protein [Bacteroidales bacterium]MDD3962091.1 glycoside hydrolase family 97 protein [Bacteroidales bacterium]MDY0286803.1 glycoside hydrolase family 97 protein [Bacteroidales bacterium]